jgi:hypothetical protein
VRGLLRVWGEQVRVTAWLIEEEGAAARFWVGGSASVGLDFSSNVDDAIRFQTKEEAERIKGFIEDIVDFTIPALVVREHIWGEVGHGMVG